jgi:hypothetical protein
MKHRTLVLFVGLQGLLEAVGKAECSSESPGPTGQLPFRPVSQGIKPRAYAWTSML